MGYIFKEKITFNEYNEFIKNYNYLPFMQENNWAKAKEYANYLIVGVYNDSKLCATALILIKKKKRDNLFYIPNGYLLDFNNKELLAFMTNNIKLLAHKYHAYVIDIYPYLTTSDKNYREIHNNLIACGYNWENKYLDDTNNILISLYKGNKKVSKLDLKKQFDEEYFIKRGISYELSDNLEDIKRLDLLIDNECFDTDLIGSMFINFENRIKMLFIKLDLVFYLNYLKEENANEEDIIKVDELIHTLGETIDIGCALIILPYNKRKRVCEVTYNTIKDIVFNLDINKAILYQSLLVAHENNCQYLKLSNIDLDTDYYVHNYQATSIKYIGHYFIVINKLLHFLNKEIKKKDK